jgi:hypothetical protein
MTTGFQSRLDEKRGSRQVQAGVMAKRRAAGRTKKRGGTRAPQQLSLFDLPSAPSAPTPASGAKVKRSRAPRKPAVEAPAVLTAAEAALYLNLRPATLKSWRAKKIGPVHIRRAARLIGYTKAALDAFLARGAALKP